MITVFENARIFDGVSADTPDGTVVVEAERIREISSAAFRGHRDLTIDCRGRFLIPGLIDAHFHAYSPTWDIFGNDVLPASLMTSHAARILEGALERGFTTVRDAGGGDVGLRMAIDRGLIKGPRFFFPGRALSQTGGHGDYRPPAQADLCGCEGYRGTLSMTVDGPDEVRKAAREQLRHGATHIKIFASGGGVSPSDPIWMPQFTEAEVRAAVSEASTRRTYVMAHTHTDDAARRCADYGVRTIEHGTMIHKSETARVIAERGAFVVPTLSVIQALLKSSPLPLDAAKAAFVRECYGMMLHSIEVCRRAGIRLGLGCDLLGTQFHPLQGGELALRGEVESAVDVLRSATSINAEILQQAGQLGCIAPNAYADILVLEGNPFTDLGLFREPLKNIRIVMKGGELVRKAD